MSDRIVVEQGSPTLAGLKPASLFSVFFDGPVREVYAEIRRINEILVPKGLRFLPLSITGNRALMFLYRETALNLHIVRSDVQEILAGLGYRCRTTAEYISEISKRIRSGSDFPHEIGLFLGYPPSDVRAFMQHQCEGCKAVGCWKAYGDEEEAQRTFDLYKACTKCYCRQYARGRKLSELAVATA